jgi:2-polyprenyl-6-methoxyphenol hydroxylase-like FAD-dependent oxidoreductase
MTDEILDVAIVGYGPTGQMLAALLGKRGNKVTAFERHTALYALPRASALDHEIARSLQWLGVMDRYLEVSAEPAAKYHWINGDGKLLMTIDWGKPEIDGFFNMYIGFQPRFEDCLNEAAEASGNVVVHRGWEITSIAHRDDGLVTLRAAELRRGEDGKRVATGVEREVTARYVIAADGGNSQVRARLGIELEDWHFRSEWLVVDGQVKRQLGGKARVLGDQVVRFNNELIQLCDPKRPMYFGPLGKGGRRFEFAMLPGETVEDMEKPARAWELLRDAWGVMPEDFEIYRNIVYGFNSFMAKEWRQQNVFLAGDAAHAMPPYLGQGLNTGLRDVVNLAWKLDFVLKGLAAPDLLDSYQLERAGNARYYIEASLAVGAVSCTFDPVAAAERDAAFAEGRAQPPAESPGIVDGLLLKDSAGQVARPAGWLGPQAQVRYQGAVGRLDDIARTGSFTLLAYKFDPRPMLDASQRDYLDRLGAKIVVIGPQDANDAAVAADITGVYKDYFESRNLAAIVVRPDFYIFGGASAATDLPSVIDALREMLPVLSGKHAGRSKPVPAFASR